MEWVRQRLEMMRRINREFLCKIIGHDYDMTFPFREKERALDWLFVCHRCGHTTTDQYKAAWGKD